jgi:hypothetical protein
MLSAYVSNAIVAHIKEEYNYILITTTFILLAKVAFLYQNPFLKTTLSIISTNKSVERNR